MSVCLSKAHNFLWCPCMNPGFIYLHGVHMFTSLHVLHVSALGSHFLVVSVSPHFWVLSLYPSELTSLDGPCIHLRFISMQGSHLSVMSVFESRLHTALWYPCAQTSGWGPCVYSFVLRPCVHQGSNLCVMSAYKSRVHGISMCSHFWVVSLCHSHHCMLSVCSTSV